MHTCRGELHAASINKVTHNKLTAAVKAGALVIAEGCHVMAATPVEGGVRLQTSPPPDDSGSWEEVWLAVGDAMDVRRDPVLGQLLVSHPTQVHILLLPLAQELLCPFNLLSCTNMVVPDNGVATWWLPLAMEKEDVLPPRCIP